MFVKVFTQIFDSSIAENYEVRHFFEDMLKLADSEGVVDMTVEAISRRTNVPMDKVRAGLDELLKPDPRSRSPEHEGRRIIPLDSHRDWGWIIVNYQHYRMLRDEESRRSYFRDAKRKQRTKEKTEEPPQTVRQTEKPEIYSSGCRVLLHYLKEKTGRQFRELASSLEPINARLKEDGVTVEGCKQMIDRQVGRWKGTSQEEYLRPTTLFGKEKFDGYYAAKDLPISTVDGQTAPVSETKQQRDKRLVEESLR